MTAKISVLWITTWQLRGRWDCHTFLKKGPVGKSLAVSCCCRKIQLFCYATHLISHRVVWVNFKQNWNLWTKALVGREPHPIEHVTPTLSANFSSYTLPSDMKTHLPFDFIQILHARGPFQYQNCATNKSGSRMLYNFGSQFKYAKSSSTGVYCES